MHMEMFQILLTEESLNIFLKFIARNKNIDTLKIKFAEFDVSIDVWKEFAELVPKSSRLDAQHAKP